MRIIVWGLGNYYRKKEECVPKDSIIAFVSGQESGGEYKGIKIINPENLSQYSFDQLYIMTGVKVTFEILNELRDLKFQEWEKIVFGWSIPPYTNEEAVLFEDGEMKCNATGICVYGSNDQAIEINNEADWFKLVQKKVRMKKENKLADIAIEPISRVFGFDRGLPIDRYYIEKFLSENSRYIKGTVLEIGEQTYTKKYGREVEKNYILHVSESIGENGMVADLATGLGTVDCMADCFILTQTLSFIYDIKAAANNVVRFLKQGGVALITVSGIAQISRYDMDRWGHYWSFTTASLKKLFEECDDVESVEVKAYGNVKTVTYGLYGLAVEDIDESDLAYCDDDYQQIIIAVVKKRKSKR